MGISSSTSRASAPIPDPTITTDQDSQEAQSQMIKLVKELKNAVAKNRNKTIIMGILTGIVALYMTNPNIFQNMMDDPMKTFSEYFMSSSFGTNQKRKKFSRKIKSKKQRRSCRKRK